MEKIAYKLFTFGDFDEEEVWLNAMVEQGWALKSVHWMKYSFEACQKGEYIYRLDYMGNKDEEQIAEYRQILEDAGAQYVTQINNWYYFRQKSELGDFELYSDIESKITYLKKIKNTIMLVALANLSSFLLLILPRLFVGKDGFIQIIYWTTAILQILVFLSFGLGLFKLFSREKALKDQAELFQ